MYLDYSLTNSAEDNRKLIHNEKKHLNNRKIWPNNRLMLSFYQIFIFSGFKKDFHTVEHSTSPRSIKDMEYVSCLEIS